MSWADQSGWALNSSGKCMNVCSPWTNKRPEKLVVGVAPPWKTVSSRAGKRPSDRLNAAEAVPVLVDERYERVCGRSS